MKQSIYIVLLSLTFSTYTISQKRAMTVDDGLNMIQIRGAKISPDASRILFSKSELDWEKNKRKTSHHSIFPDGSETYKFLGGENDNDIKFSPNGKFISFKRTVDKKSQLFKMRAMGGEATQLTKHEMSIGAYQWGPKSQFIYFMANEEKSKDVQKEIKDGSDHVFIDEGPNGQRKGEWRHLFKINIDSSKTIPVIKQKLRIGQFDIHPDGQRIAYTARQENRRNQGNHSEIYIYNQNDSITVQVTANAAPESSMKWSPSGDDLAFMAADILKWELKNSKIWKYNLTSKDITLISKKFEGNIRGYYWSGDGQHIYFNGTHGPSTNLMSLNVKTGTVSNLSNSDGSWRMLDMNSDRTAAVLTYDDFDTPRDLYYSKLPLFEPVKLTDLNPLVEKDLELAKMELKQWNSHDGLEIEGLLYMPKDFNADATNPLLLHIHGGPAGVFTNSFNYRYHVWAGLGYVQLAPNVRGSSGYTDSLLRGNMKDIGGGDYQDLIHGADMLVKEKYVDPDKQAVRGWSYGGILGGTTVTKTGRFKAASLGAMVSDWTSEYGIGFNFDVSLWYIGKTPWENPEGYRDKSPLTHVQKVTTPVLLMHGDKDITDTEAQSMMFFNALKDLGKEVRYIQFPREPHGFREPRHIRTRDIEEIKWIQKYTLNQEWKPWERPKKKEKEEKKVDKA